VASKRVRPGGSVLGVDLKRLDKIDDNVATVVGDVRVESTLERLITELRGLADVVLSDLSPDVSGVWDLDHQRQVDLTLRVIDAFPSLLKRDGNAVLKIFQGERFEEVRSRLKEDFQIVKLVKPKASRSESSEMYFVCLHFR